MNKEQILERFQEMDAGREKPPAAGEPGP